MAAGCVGRLDVRRVAPRHRGARALTAVAALAAGHSLELVSRDDPRPLLRELHAACGCRFDWAFLEAGPMRYRVAISRRRRPGPRSVGEYLSWDHHRLNALLAATRRAVAAGDFTAARRRYAELACGLGLHIVMEEEVLFPAFERGAHRSVSPVAAERASHAEARGLTIALGLALKRRNRARFTATAAVLQSDLLEHQGREEAILYAISDRLAGDERDRHELLLRMRTV